MKKESLFVEGNDRFGINIPELSDKWECEMFGMERNGFVLTPEKGKEPNWFWRKMQYLILGNKWVKKTK